MNPELFKILCRESPLSDRAYKILLNAIKKRYSQVEIKNLLDTDREHLIELGYNINGEIVELT